MQSRRNSDILRQSALAHLERRVRGMTFRKTSGHAFRADKFSAVTYAKSKRCGTGGHLGRRTGTDGGAQCFAKEKNKDQVNKPFRSLDRGSLSLGLTYKMCFSIDSVSQKSVLLLDSSSFVFFFKVY